jgi:hypothetical protein
LLSLIFIQASSSFFFFRHTLDEGPGSNFLGTNLVSATLEIQTDSLRFCSKLFTRLICSARSVCRYHTCSVNKAIPD